MYYYLGVRKYHSMHMEVRGQLCGVIFSCCLCLDPGERICVPSFAQISPVPSLQPQILYSFCLFLVRVLLYISQVGLKLAIPSQYPTCQDCRYHYVCLYLP